jgi:hypothetical protein
LLFRHFRHGDFFSPVAQSRHYGLVGSL